MSERPTAAVSDAECRLPHNAVPKLLDVIDVPLLKAAPHNHQTENHVIAKEPWTKVGELPWDELDKLVEHPKTLWINSGSTSAGLFNCISQAEADTLHDSLVLVNSKKFTIEVGSKSWEGKTKKSYRGNFNFNGTFHSLSLTDPMVTNAFSSKDVGVYEFADVYLCISLTEPWERDNNRCYKLVAAVFGKEPW